MNKNLRKLLAVSVIIVVLFSLIGCTTDKTNGQATSESTSVQTAQSTLDGPLKETIDITWGGWGTLPTGQEESVIAKKLEEKFNVKIKFVKVDTENPDKVKMLLLSGEGPDVSRLFSDTQQFFKDGMIRSIPVDYIKKYAPGHAAFLDKKLGGWKYLMQPGKKDSMLGLAGTDETVTGVYLVPTMRLDWLEKSPIKPKGALEDIDGKGKVFLTKEAFSIDELTEILNYFANGDPDGNGKKDTYGIVPSADPTNEEGLSDYTFMSIAGSFGLGSQYYFNYLVDGKEVHQHINPAFKDVLKLLNKWWKMGIIDKEYLTNNFFTMNEKLGNGLAGYEQCQVPNFNYESPDYATQFPANLIVKDPNAKILITPPEKGKMQAVKEYFLVNTLCADTTIGINVSDEKLKRILMIFDYTHNTSEGYNLARYGIENETFTWTGEPNKSAVKMLKPDDPNAYGIFSSGMYGQAYMDVNYNDGVKFVSNYFQLGEGASFASIKTYKADFYNTTGWRDVKKQYHTALKTLFNEFVNKSIMGEIDIDAEWDNYVQKWMQSGGDKYLAEIAKMPTLEELKK